MCLKNKRLTVAPTTQDKLYKVLKNPFKGPNDNRALRLNIADNIVESLDFDPILRIIDLLNTKYSRKISDEKGIKRTFASLQRLGYKWSDINSAFRRLEIETEEIDDV